ncbi:MAG: dockerin type I repeat-containing protein, partial [Ruminococcus sp.]|nr:dockerin type I repeat-containing protein [Ruminococcus sp.]
GDLDGNGVINVNDIVKLAAHIKGKRMLSAAAIKAADVNGDGKLDINDLVKIAAHVKGKRLLY